MIYIFKRLSFIVITEGAKGLFERIADMVLFKLNLRRSETLFFYLSISQYIQSKNFSIHPLLCDIELRIISNSSELRQFKKYPEKMNYIPTNKWFARGSRCLAIVLNNRIIAYTWIHTNFYDNLNLGSHRVFQVEKNEAFIGPFYTDSNYRKMGLYYQLMQRSLQWLQKNNVKNIYGSSNVFNIATVKVFMRNGFSILGIVNAWKNRAEILDFDLLRLLSGKIKENTK